MTHVKYLILGAGVSGLAFASRVKDEDYLIIEKEDEAGGYCRTIRSGEYVWDYAGHFFHFSHPELKAAFEEITSSDDTVHRVKETKIYYKGYYVDYPFQKNIHQLTKDEMIDCLYDLFYKVEKDCYDSFEDMLYGKFGNSITEKFLKPYNEKLYACNLNMLDVDAMGRFFPYADIKEIISNMRISNNASYNAEFLYPKQGAAVFVDKLLEEVDTRRIHYAEVVQAVDTEKKIVRTDKGEYQYEVLVTSIPMNEFAAMVDFKSEIDQSIFSYNQVLVFNIGFDKPAVDPNIHWIYVPSKDINFYRAGYYNNIIGNENLSMYIEIGYEGGCVVTKEEIDKQLQLTLENLKRMGITVDHQLVDYRAIVMNPAYVHITKRGIEVVSDFKQKLNARDVYTVGRYGDWKYCSIEDCMVDYIKTAEGVKK